MITLALDASTRRASVAITELDANGHSHVLAYTKSENPKTHSEFMNVGIAEALKKSSLGFDQLNRIAVGIGPGSFTGIRVALNIAKTISYTKKLPILAHTSFEILCSQRPHSNLLCLLNAYKGQAFTHFQQAAGAGNWGPGAYLVEEVEKRLDKTTGPILGLGDFFSDFMHLLPPPILQRVQRSKELEDYPDAILLAKLSEKSTSTIDWKMLQPLYIRESEAEENLKSK